MGFFAAVLRVASGESKQTKNQPVDILPDQYPMTSIIPVFLE